MSVGYMVGMALSVVAWAFSLIVLAAAPPVCGTGNCLGQHRCRCSHQMDEMCRKPSMREVILLCARRRPDRLGGPRCARRPEAGLMGVQTFHLDLGGGGGMRCGRSGQAFWNSWERLARCGVRFLRWRDGALRPSAASPNPDRSAYRSVGPRSDPIHACRVRVRGIDSGNVGSLGGLGVPAGRDHCRPISASAARPRRQSPPRIRRADLRRICRHGLRRGGLTFVTEAPTPPLVAPEALPLDKVP